MAEYIERDAAIVAIKNLYPGIPLAKIRLQKWHEENKNFMECELAIERIPAADVVPVVRCKDCEYWDATQEAPRSEGCFLCTLEGGYPKGDFYCALGERRMDGDGDV